MPTYPTTVVGVHDSPTGMRAVELAAPLAAETSANLVLVAAYRSRPDDEESRQEPGRAAAERTLETAAALCAENGVDRVEVVAAAGPPVEVLCTATREYRADLLWVGSHGLSTLSGRLFGSVPSEVTRKAQCDVLVVHTTTDRWRRLVHPLHRRRPPGYQRTIVVGIHDSSRSMRAASRAGGIAADFDAEVILVGAYQEPDRDATREAERALKGEAYLARPSFGIEAALREGEERARTAGARKVRSMEVRGDAVSRLLAVADQEHADIVVLGNHQDTVGDQLVDTINAQVSRRTPTHVLLVH